MPFEEVSVDTDIRIRCNADPEFRNAWAAKRFDLCAAKVISFLVGAVMTRF